MSKSYSAAEVREIVGFLLGHESGPMKGVDFTSNAVKQFFQTSEGDLRYWGAFKEVFAFAYDPDTLEVATVERTEDFAGDPTAELMTGLKDRHYGLSIEVWGVRHAWAAWCGDRTVGPECLHSFGRRPKGDGDILRVVEAAQNFQPPAGPYLR